MLLATPALLIVPGDEILIGRRPATVLNTVLFADEVCPDVALVYCVRDGHTAGVRLAQDDYVTRIVPERTPR